MVSEPGELRPSFMNRKTLECDKKLSGSVNSLSWEENVPLMCSSYASPLNCSTSKPVETQAPKILPIARSYYNDATKWNTVNYSNPCVCLPHCSLFESHLGTPPQTRLTLRLDDVKKDMMAPSRPLTLDGSLECPPISETSRNTRKAFERMSVAIQEHRNAPTRILGSLEKVTFSKHGAARDSMGQLPHHLNVLPLPHESMTNNNIGCTTESSTQIKPLGQSTKMLQKPRGLSSIRDIYTEEDMLDFFDLRSSTNSISLMPPNDSSVSILKNNCSGKLFSENLSVINTALAVSFRRDGAKRRPVHSRVTVCPTQKKKFYMDTINAPNVGQADKGQ
ncbi:unnamed protein product [Phytomonas sp. EM1]|nr:unnamed protein product [Phytomonas sp. EM1]|eukprot:CCW61999.1 unnamed protein product [Phytomonas sp. isolate EM1]